MRRGYYGCSMPAGYCGCPQESRARCRHAHWVEQHPGLPADMTAGDVIALFSLPDDDDTMHSGQSR